MPQAAAHPATTAANAAARAAKTVLVTGAAQRLGKAIALHLAREGWQVVVHYHRSEAAAQQTVAEIVAAGGRAHALQANLARPEEIITLIEQSRRHCGAIQALVNSAALFEYDRADTAHLDSWNRHLDVNLRAPWLLAKAVYGQLEDDVGEVGVGCIVNILDQKVFNLNPDYFSYTISKIGLEGMTKMLALEFAPKMRVCALAPGLSLLSGEQTPENFAKAHTATPLGRSSDASDIAHGVSYLLDAKSVTGSTLIVDGGQHLYPLKRDIMFAIEDSNST